MVQRSKRARPDPRARHSRRGRRGRGRKEARSLARRRSSVAPRPASPRGDARAPLWLSAPHAAARPLRQERTTVKSETDMNDEREPQDESPSPIDDADQLRLFGDGEWWESEWKGMP